MKKTMIFAALLFGLAGTASAETVKLCTGAIDANYYAAGKAIAKMAAASLKIEVVESEGTLENLERSIDTPSTDPKSCDAFIGQPDGPVYYVRTKPATKAMIRQVGELHREYLHVLVNKNSGISDLGDLSGNTKKTLAIGERGSGAWLVWQNILAEDNSYAKVPVSLEGGILALAEVSSGTTDAMLVPAGIGNGTAASASNNHSSSVALVGANDKDFNDALDVRGKPLYEYAKIPGSSYKKLLCGTFTCSNISTISWRAGVYVNVEKVSDRSTLIKFADAVGRATPAIVSSFGE